MATLYESHEKRFNAKYLCKKCNETWKTKNTSHLKMICKNRDCRRLVRAYKFEVIDKLVVYQCPHCFQKIKKTKCSKEVKEVPYCTICQQDMKVLFVKNLWVKRRLFGYFRCDDCSNQWSSGYAWEGYGQECRNCNIMILPYNLEPLKITSSPRGKQPHRQDLCEMCKELGHNCKEYVPTPSDIASINEIPLEEDTQSVITTNSSVIGGDDDGNSDNDSTDGGDRTPINLSDEELENDEDVVGMFVKLNIKK